MLTSRGWWFLILLITLCGVGGVLATRDRPALWCAVFALGLWFLFEWSAFLYRARITLPKLTATRSLRDSRGPVTMLWCHQTYQTQVEVQLAGGRLPIAELTDRRPVGAELVDEPGQFAGMIDSRRPIAWSTTFRAATPGVVRFEGVRVRLADAQGFFYVERFLRDPLEVLALPADPVSEFARRADKRVNLLPPPGVHRHRRPGTGSELLELRDYRPGDPPRQIAWKISARRDTLITREYESEVPLRCTLVIDSSAASRRGPAGKTPLARSAGVAA
ncbi:MAG: DUF58 domain-containing protein, partial [Gemmataceae bacterium]|nr:DUF58 domain-containing protein [Gemmataceae bacterium]